MVRNIDDLTGQIIEKTNATIGSIDDINAASQNGLTLISDTESAVKRLSDSISSTHEAVSGVARYSEQIAGLSENIKTIAEQTNLLALNAAIESARAGEHGRGFAVVADEVRNLAVKTRESTEEIQSTVTALTTSMRETIERVALSTEDCQQTIDHNSQALSFLTDIMNRIGTTTSQAREITEYAQQQSDLLSSANKEIEKINLSQDEIQLSMDHVSDSSRQTEEATEKAISELLLE